MHPNENTATVLLKTEDLLQIIKEHGKMDAVAQLQILEYTAEILADGTIAEKEPF